MLLFLFKVEGHSMEPSFTNGSFFIASSIPFILSKPKLGDVIVFKNGNKNIVKRIFKIEDKKYFMQGDNRLDSKDFEPIKRKEIIGKVIGKI